MGKILLNRLKTTGFVEVCLYTNWPDSNYPLLYINIFFLSRYNSTCLTLRRSRSQDEISKQKLLNWQIGCKPSKSEITLSNHKSNEDFKCSKCNAVFKKIKSYERHKSLPCKKFKCEDCNEIFKKRSAFLLHGFSSHNKDIPCRKCDRSFKSFKSYVYHKCKHTSRSLYSCDLCDYKTPRKYEIKSHRKRHLKEYAYTCPECLRGFYTKPEYEVHMNKHTGDMPFQCDVCGKSYALSASLRKHRMRFHSELYPDIYTCHVCQRVITKLKTFESHMKIHETGSSTYVCDICGKSMSSRTVLNNHRRIHTGEMPFQCDICKRCFSAKKYLISHSRVHTGEKPHACRFCKKTFAQRTSLTVHQKRCSIKKEVIDFDNSFDFYKQLHNK